MYITNDYGNSLKLHERLGKCNLKEVSNITNSLNPQLLIYYMTEKIAIYECQSSTNMCLFTSKRFY